MLTAFFLEATFLGIMLFGWSRVPRWLHVMSAIVVAVGTAISAFWILAANSWMQTPAGHEIVDGVAVPLDWWAIIFNPSFPYRLAHMLNAAYLTTGFVVLAVGARYLLADRHPRAGPHHDAHGDRAAGGAGAAAAAHRRPARAQHAQAPADQDRRHGGALGQRRAGRLPLFAWPDEKAETNRFAISIPKAGSLILTHRLNGLFLGLKDVPPQNRPPVKTVFFAFRIMLGIGFFMIAAALVGAWLLWRGMLFETRWYLRIVAHSWWTGFVAVIAGWVVTESGRQPWVVHGILRTADAISPVPAPTVLTTLVLFVVVYGIVFAMGIYYINRLIERWAAGPRGRAAGDAARRRGRCRPPTTPDARRWLAAR